jgi:preprotein translocase subunit SecE
MESQHQKWVNLCFLAGAVLLGYVLFSFGQWLTGAYDLEARVRNIDEIVRILAIIAGGILFLVLYRNQKTNNFMGEVVLELSRVTWPTQRETTSATFVVIIMVLISGMILGLLDYVWTKLIQWIV